MAETKKRVRRSLLERSRAILQKRADKLKAELVELEAVLAKLS